MGKNNSILMFWGNFFLSESWKPIFNSNSFSVRGCWGQPMLLFWKLVDETQISKPQKYTDTFKQNLTCIFLSVRAFLKETFQCETPCINPRLLACICISKGKDHHVQIYYLLYWLDPLFKYYFIFHFFYLIWDFKFHITAVTSII